MNNKITRLWNKLKPVFKFYCHQKILSHFDKGKSQRILNQPKFSIMLVLLQVGHTCRFWWMYQVSGMMNKFTWECLDKKANIETNFLTERRRHLDLIQAPTQPMKLTKETRAPRLIRRMLNDLNSPWFGIESWVETSARMSVPFAFDPWLCWKSQSPIPTVAKPANWNSDKNAVNTYLHMPHLIK